MIFKNNIADIYASWCNEFSLEYKIISMLSKMIRTNCLVCFHFIITDNRTRELMAHAKMISTRLSSIPWGLSANWIGNRVVIAFILFFFFFPYCKVGGHAGLELRKYWLGWLIYIYKPVCMKYLLAPYSAYCTEKAMAPHSGTLAWRIPHMEEPGGLQSMGSLRVGRAWATSLWLFTFVCWRRKWKPTPVFLPGESQGRGSLVGCHLWGRTESDTTEAT